MKNKPFFASAMASAVILLLTSIASAVPLVNIVYNETDLGGSWQYDYTLYNTSTTVESLYSVYFILPQVLDVTGVSLPNGWDGVPWTGTNTTDFLNAYSTDFPYDILAGDALGGFSFITDSQVGNIYYMAIISGDNVVQGTTAPVPEPGSAILFASGAAALAASRFRKNRKV